MPKKFRLMRLEVHFQEGFYNNTARVLINNKSRAELVLTTKTQTGLAAIRRLAANVGDTFQIEIPALHISEKFRVDEGDKYITASLQNGKLVVGGAKALPGYV